MRIAIAGKGGSGKTTLAGGIIAELARRGRRVLAIDGDTNPNLSVVLGHAVPAPELTALPNDLLIRKERDDGTAYTELRISGPEVLQQYATAVQPDVRLLVMGRVDHAGVG